MFTFRAARYSKFSFCSIFKVVGLLDHLTCLDSSIFKLFGLLDIQSFRDARYPNVTARSIFKLKGLPDIRTFSGWSIFKKLSGCSILKAFGLLDIQAFRAARHSNCVDWSKVFGLLDIHSFRAARYSKYSACSIFSLFGPLGIQSYKLFDIQNFPSCQSIFYFSGCSIF